MAICVSPIASLSATINDCADYITGLGIDTESVLKSVVLSYDSSPILHEASATEAVYSYAVDIEELTNIAIDCEILVDSIVCEAIEEVRSILDKARVQPLERVLDMQIVNGMCFIHTGE